MPLNLVRRFLRGTELRKLEKSGDLLNIGCTKKSFALFMSETVWFFVLIITLWILFWLYFATWKTRSFERIFRIYACSFLIFCQLSITNLWIFLYIFESVLPRLFFYQVLLLIIIYLLFRLASIFVRISILLWILFNLWEEIWWGWFLKIFGLI